MCDRQLLCMSQSTETCRCDRQFLCMSQSTETCRCDRQLLCMSQSTETCRCVTDSTGTVRLTAGRQAPTATVSSASVDRDWRRETSSSPATRSVLPASASRRVSSPPKPALQALQVRANAQVLLHDMACRYNCTMLIIFMFLTLCNVFFIHQTLLWLQMAAPNSTVKVSVLPAARRCWTRPATVTAATATSSRSLAMSSSP